MDGYYSLNRRGVLVGGMADSREGLFLFLGTADSRGGLFMGTADNRGALFLFLDMADNRGGLFLDIVEGYHALQTIFPPCLVPIGVLGGGHYNQPVSLLEGKVMR